MSSLPEPPQLDFCSAHRRHFLQLSVLFLFPLSLFTNIYFPLQTLLTSSSFSQFHHHSITLLRHHHPITLLRHHFPTTTTNPTVTANTAVSLLLLLIYDVVALFISLLAVGSITFSVYHISFRRRPVKFMTSILSLLRSFVPLLLTSLASLLLQFLISFAFGVVQFLILVFQVMVFGIDQTSPFFFWPCLIVGAVLLLVLIYLQVNWALSSIIIVVESSWGVEALQRSTKLVKGMRGITLSLMVIYGIGSGAWVFLMGLSFIGYEFDGGVWSWRSWLFANTVLYMSCKAVHGELVVAGEEFDGEYVSLPSDDGQLDHAVSVIPNSEFGMP